MKSLLPLCITAALALSGPCQAATELIPLGYRSADEVLSIAQTVIGDQGRVNAYGNQLIVNAPDALIAELRSVLAQLDTPPRTLLISVRSSEHTQRDANGFSIDGNVDIGNTRIGTGPSDDRDSARIIRRDSRSRDGSLQQVQATEGYPALIQVGQSVPLTEWTTDAYGQVYRDTRYHDLIRGFYATANVVDDRVQVTISSSDERLSRDTSGVVESRTADTRISGQIGEWLTIGGFDEQSSSRDSGLARRYDTGSSQDYSLQLKVELVE